MLRLHNRDAYAPGPGRFHNKGPGIGDRKLILLSSICVVPHYTVVAVRA